MTATWNPSDKNAAITLSAGDLTASDTGSDGRGVRATLGQSTGKLYFEGFITGPQCRLYLALGSSSLASDFFEGPLEMGLYLTSFGSAYGLRNGGFDFLASYTYDGTHNVGIAVDFDSGKVWFRLDGVWLASGDPATGANPVYTGYTAGVHYPLWVSSYDGVPSSCDIKLQAGTTTYSVPSGFTVWDPVPTGVAEGTSTAQAVGFANIVKGAGAAAGSSTAGAAGTMASGSYTRTVFNSLDKGSNVTILEGGLAAQVTSGSGGVRTTRGRSTGKYYFECAIQGGELDFVSGPPYMASYQNGGSSGDIGTTPILSGGSSYQYARVCVDLNMNRWWLDVNNDHWNGSSDPPSGYKVFYTQGLGNGHPVYLGFSRFSANPAGKAWLRLALQDFRYSVPAGFMPWDDFLDPGVAIASAAGVGAAAGRSRLAVSAAAGVGAAAAVGGKMVAAVGASSGAGAAQALGSSDVAVGAASGSSTTLGKSQVTVAAAAGTSSTEATSLTIKEGVGAAAGTSTAISAPVTRDISIGTTAQGATSSFISGAITSGSNVDLRDGVGYFIPGPGSVEVGGGDFVVALATSPPSSVEHTTFLPQVRTIKAIEIWNSDYANNALTPGGATANNETFPVGAGGVDHAYVSYDPTGSSGYTPVPGMYPIYNTGRFIRWRLEFAEWLSAKYIKVEINNNDLVDDSGHLRYSEVSVFSPGVLSTMEIEDVVVATDALLAVHRNAWESTAAETDTLSGRRIANLVDTAQAAAVAEITWSEKAVAAAAGTSKGAARTILQEILEDVGNATATVLLSRTLELQSEGQATATAPTKTVHREESTGAADDALEGEDVTTNSEESTGNATDTVIGIRRVTVIEESGGGVQADSVVGGVADIELTSVGVASSVAVTRSKQTETLESTGFAEDTVLLPFQGSLPVFWSNSVSAGAATWNGLPFNSFIEADGVVYAAGPAGLYELGDDLDDLNEDVPTEIEWDLVDYGDVRMKRLRSMYVNARTRAPFTVRVANEQGIFEYQTAEADSDTMTNHRAPIGRGITSRLVRLSLLHTKAFAAENAGVGVLPSTRRI